MTEKQHLFSVTKKDLKIETMRGSGAGGQHRNRTESCVRITHPDSGAVGYCCDSKSQKQNKKKAFDRLINSDKFKKWQKIQLAKAMGKYADIESKVDDMMKDENLKVEYYTPETK